MKRRKAIQTLAVMAGGTILLPACRNIPTFSNIPLTRHQYGTIETLINIILPKPETPEITTPETTVNFVLTMVNDCYSPENIDRFNQGLQAFQEFTNDANFQPDLFYDTFFAGVNDCENCPEQMVYFLNTTKNLSVRHFTSSEYFLTQKMNWEFVPGRFVGCAPL